MVPFARISKGWTLSVPRGELCFVGSRTRKPASRSKRRTWAKWLLILVALGLIFPIFEVACVRFIDPPFTPLMGLRRIQAKFSARHRSRTLYQWLPLRQMPLAFLKDAWISEDQRFFQHHGFDFQEIQRDIKESEKKGKPARGASTITMQCARSTFLWQGRSWARKGFEAYYTVLMEAFLSKKRIFELYANVIEMGDGVYGVQAAAEYYYRAPAASLTREQAALLAAMLPNPRGWDPLHPDAALVKRQQHILREEKSVRFPIELLR